MQLVGGACWLCGVGGVGVVLGLGAGGGVGDKGGVLLPRLVSLTCSAEAVRDASSSSSSISIASSMSIHRLSLSSSLISGTTVAFQALFVLLIIWVVVHDIIGYISGLSLSTLVAGHCFCSSCHATS